MKAPEALEIWFVTGSQPLYGPEALIQVAENSRAIAASFHAETSIPCKVVFKPVLTTPEQIRGLCREANNQEKCIGLMLWMHTFSPAKMWIAGLGLLTKPFLHLHTQFNRELPWSSIDMDFMNLNQSAHGDREFGFITARLRLARKVVVGFWQDPETMAEIATWTRAAAGWHESQHLKIARFGDNMREVAVTAVDPQHPNVVVPVNGPLTLFSIGETPKDIRRTDLLSADRVSNGSNIWHAKTETGVLTFKPFASIQDELYRLYHEVES